MTGEKKLEISSSAALHFNAEKLAYPNHQVILKGDGGVFFKTTIDRRDTRKTDDGFWGNKTEGSKDRPEFDIARLSARHIDIESAYGLIEIDGSELSAPYGVVNVSATRGNVSYKDCKATETRVVKRTGVRSWFGKDETEEIEHIQKFSITSRDHRINAHQGRITIAGGEILASQQLAIQAKKAVRFEVTTAFSQVTSQSRHLFGSKTESRCTEAVFGTQLVAGTISIKSLDDNVSLQAVNARATQGDIDIAARSVDISDVVTEDSQQTTRSGLREFAAQAFNATVNDGYRQTCHRSHFVSSCGNVNVNATSGLLTVGAARMQGVRVSLQGAAGVVLAAKVTQDDTRQYHRNIFGNKVTGGSKPKFHSTCIDAESVDIGSSAGSVDLIGAEVTAKGGSVDISAAQDVRLRRAVATDHSRTTRTGLRKKVADFVGTYHHSNKDHEQRTRINAGQGKVDVKAAKGHIQLAGADIAGSGGHWYARQGVSSQGSQLESEHRAEKNGLSFSMLGRQRSIGSSQGHLMSGNGWPVFSMQTTKETSATMQHTPDTIDFSGTWNLSTGGAPVDLCMAGQVGTLQTDAKHISMQECRDQHNDRTDHIEKGLGLNHHGFFAQGAADCHQQRKTTGKAPQLAIGKMACENPGARVELMGTDLTVGELSGKPTVDARRTVNTDEQTRLQASGQATLGWKLPSKKTLENMENWQDVQAKANLTSESSGVLGRQPTVKIGSGEANVEHTQEREWSHQSELNASFWAQRKGSTTVGQYSVDASYDGQSGHLAGDFVAPYQNLLQALNQLSVGGRHSGTDDKDYYQGPVPSWHHAVAQACIHAYDETNFTTRYADAFKEQGLAVASTSDKVLDSGLHKESNFFAASLKDKATGRRMVVAPGTRGMLEASDITANICAAAVGRLSPQHHAAVQYTLAEMEKHLQEWSQQAVSARNPEPRADFVQCGHSKQAAMAGFLADLFKTDAVCFDAYGNKPSLLNEAREKYGATIHQLYAKYGLPGRDSNIINYQANPNLVNGINPGDLKGEVRRLNVAKQSGVSLNSLDYTEGTHEMIGIGAAL